ncbi:MAG: DUF933 domain-containing protein [Thermogutta sp.]
MKIGLVGYQGSGKSTLFEWLTGVPADPAQAFSGQSAMAVIPDPRLEQLQRIYEAKKVTPAALEIVDTPGLSRTHQGNAAKLAILRDVGCLVMVVPAFGGFDCAAEFQSFQEDLLIADLEIVTGRLERVQASLKKPHPKPEREHLEEELKILLWVKQRLEENNPVRESEMTPEQQRVTRAFRLLCEKPQMVVINTADDEHDFSRFRGMLPENIPFFAVPLALELELSKMSPEEREQFQAELGVGGADRGSLIRTIMDVAGLHVFLTAGPKEVRAWLLRRGGTAVEAAEAIHTDLAKGFIRAEVMSCQDLVRLGSERELKAQNLVRHEHRDYVVQDDDILLIRFSADR